MMKKIVVIITYRHISDALECHQIELVRKEHGM